MQFFAATSKHKLEVSEYELRVTSLTERLAVAQGKIEDLTKAHQSNKATITAVLFTTLLTVENSTN